MGTRIRSSVTWVSILLLPIRHWLLTRSECEKLTTARACARVRVARFEIRQPALPPPDWRLKSCDQTYLPLQLPKLMLNWAPICGTKPKDFYFRLVPTIFGSTFFQCFLSSERYDRVLDFFLTGSFLFIINTDL